MTCHTRGGHSTTINAMRVVDECKKLNCYIIMFRLWVYLNSTWFLPSFKNKQTKGVLVWYCSIFGTSRTCYVGKKIFEWLSSLFVYKFVYKRKAKTISSIKHVDPHMTYRFHQNLGSVWKSSEIRMSPKITLGTYVPKRKAPNYSYIHYTFQVQFSWHTQIRFCTWIFFWKKICNTKSGTYKQVLFILSL